MNLTEQQQKQAKLGKDLADILGLKKDHQGFYKTAWGNKTDLGLYLTVKCVIERGVENDNF